MIKLYLASASPRRKEILNLMQLDFKVECAPANEELCKDVSMENAGEILSARKALALKERLIRSGEFDEDTLILAADTLVYLGGERLGKPSDAFDAQRMLKALSGNKHCVCTGTCLMGYKNSISTSEVSEVYMRDFTEDEILSYIATGEPLDKAGAYAVQGIGASLINRIDGDFFSVMGLSPKTVCKLFQAFGISYFNLINK